MACSSKATEASFLKTTELSNPPFSRWRRIRRWLLIAFLLPIVALVIAVFTIPHSRTLIRWWTADLDARYAMREQIYALLERGMTFRQVVFILQGPKEAYVDKLPSIPTPKEYHVSFQTATTPKNAMTMPADSIRFPGCQGCG